MTHKTNSNFFLLSEECKLSYWLMNIYIYIYIYIYIRSAPIESVSFVTVIFT